ncbi:MAG: hypothetical protein JRF36_09445 [Deltaproteobacteria bacterium]|jgi:hypothetical protein|nr:hypothetical protein [Deltaproteobacteria bacterium]MBW2518385.1 hypothetical protein [Deltaproteobacteria bacterium]
MDLDSVFRNKVESLLVTASWVEQVQQMLDLKGVSQVWGDRPEWYVWIDDTPGVYALVFEGGEAIQAADQTLYAGRFAAKCYPYVSAGVFEAFSPREREVIKSDLFDHTHTPCLETQQEVPEAFFTIGSISLVADAAETVALFTFDSLDFLRWSTLSAETGSENHLHEKNCIRDIPGWQVGYPLFDRLVSLYAFYVKKPPAFIAATRSPGFETIIDAHQSPVSRVCADIQQLSTSVLFANPADTDAWAGTLWRSQLEPEEQIVFEHACTHSACSNSADNGLPPVGINTLWWDLAHANLKSELASTCGCKDHEHHACEVEKV